MAASFSRRISRIRSFADSVSVPQEIAPVSVKQLEGCSLEPRNAEAKHEGFFDHSIAVRVQQFGIMAHVGASYEPRNNQSDPKPFVRGVKSFELPNRGGRWYITQVAWVREEKNNPIPAFTCTTT